MDAVDDVIMFFTNIFTVIPTFVLLILISFSIGQEKRGPVTIAVVIGFTSWVWTARAVRAQVISLRNRDHVNLSKLSGHPIALIIFTDILPYIASYVFMALILQISTAILAEAVVVDPRVGTKNFYDSNFGLDDELGVDLHGTKHRKMVGVLPCDRRHRSDFVLAELDEHWSRPGIQSGFEGIGDCICQKSCLEVKDLTTKYITRYNEDIYAVDHVSLKVEEGKTLGIAGESGCGKSTLALSLMGYYFAPLHYTSGEIIIDGRNISGMDPDDRS